MARSFLLVSTWRPGSLSCPRAQLRPCERRRIDDGEVSPYLTQILEPGDKLELRGPIGGWFVWRPDEEAQVLLVGGGSGIVPLMAMLRQRVATGGVNFRLVYSARSPADVYYAQELSRLDRDCDWLQVTLLYTRSAPPPTTRPPGRVRAADLATTRWAIHDGLRSYVCGPTGFVESVTAKLTELGHRPSAIRTERFGPSN